MKSSVQNGRNHLSSEGTEASGAGWSNKWRKKREKSGADGVNKVPSVKFKTQSSLSNRPVTLNKSGRRWRVGGGAAQFSRHNGSSGLSGVHFASLIASSCSLLAVKPLKLQKKNNPAADCCSLKRKLVRERSRWGQLLCTVPAHASRAFASASQKRFQPQKKSCCNSPALPPSG